MKILLLLLLPVISYSQIVRTSPPYTPVVSAHGTFTTSATNAGTAVDDATVGTGLAWANPGNITTPGTPYATVSVGASQFSHYIVATGYGFSIPPGATILGITVTINRRVTTSIATVSDKFVRLVQNGVIITASTFAGGSSILFPSNATFGVATYGGVSNTWSFSAGVLTPTDINASNFGIAFSTSNASGSSRNIELDYIQIAITYSI